MSSTLVAEPRVEKMPRPTLYFILYTLAEPRVEKTTNWARCTGCISTWLETAISYFILSDLGAMRQQRSGNKSSSGSDRTATKWEGAAQRGARERDTTLYFILYTATRRVGETRNASVKR